MWERKIVFFFLIKSTHETQQEAPGKAIERTQSSQYLIADLNKVVSLFSSEFTGTL